MLFSAATSVATVLALPFAQPLPDRELAHTATMVSPPVQRYAAVEPYSQLERLPTAEMVDYWWAYTGSELIADAARSALTMPAGLDGLRFDGGTLSFDLRIAVMASTRSYLVDRDLRASA